MSIIEFPGLQIDDFRVLKDAPIPQLCLLSHMHSDHLIGLDRRHYNGPLVYCSHATRAMVLNIRENKGQGRHKYHHLRKESCGTEVLQGLQFDQPYQLACGSMKLEITMIATDHCPGSAMFLVKSSKEAILFTGDIRCERWYVNSLRRHSQLLSYVVREQISLYVDSTYESHFDPWRSYSENEEGLAELKRLLRRYPRNYRFFLMASTTGYEDVLLLLAHTFRTRIHMDSYWYHLYLAAADSCPSAKSLLAMTTRSPEEARIHWCGKHMECPHRRDPTNIYIQPVVQLVRSWIDAQNAEHIYPPPGLQRDSVIHDANSELSYIWTGENLYPIHIQFLFSRHASFPELQRFVAMFRKVRSVRSLNGQQMAALEPSLPSSFDSSTSSGSGSTVSSINKHIHASTSRTAGRSSSLFVRRRQAFAHDSRNIKGRDKHQSGTALSPSNSQACAEAVTMLCAPPGAKRHPQLSLQSAACDPFRLESQSDSSASRSVQGIGMGDCDENSQAGTENSTSTEISCHDTQPVEGTTPIMHEVLEDVLTPEVRISSFAPPENRTTRKVGVFPTVASSPKPARHCLKHLRPDDQSLVPLMSESTDELLESQSSLPSPPPEPEQTALPIEIRDDQTIERAHDSASNITTADLQNFPKSNKDAAVRKSNAKVKKRPKAVTVVSDELPTPVSGQILHDPMLEELLREDSTSRIWSQLHFDWRDKQQVTHKHRRLT